MKRGRFVALLAAAGALVVAVLAGCAPAPDQPDAPPARHAAADGTGSACTAERPCAITCLLYTSDAADE